MKLWRLSSSGLNHLLQLCSDFRALNLGKQTHLQIIVNGHQHYPFMRTKLIQMYAECNDIHVARLLFDKLSEPNVFAWTPIISFYSRNGLPDHCIYLYKEMKSKGVMPDHYVFPKVLKASRLSVCLRLGVQIHKDVISCGMDCSVQVCNALIDMYTKCGELGCARLVFDDMVWRDLVSWNVMISGYVCNELPELAFEMLGFMSAEGVELDTVTRNTVMDAYCRMGQCDRALKMFREIDEPNVISWTILISGFSKTGESAMTLEIFRDMIDQAKVVPDLDCLSSVLSACQQLGALKFGQEIHAYGTKHVGCGSAFYSSAGPALLALYAGCKRTQDERNIFGMMDIYDVVTWNAMISGFADSGRTKCAFDCFREMQKMGIKQNDTTISTLLPVCDVKMGKQIHAYMLKGYHSCASLVWNALIHMYAKCGCVDLAHSLFSRMEYRDVVSWNTMMRGLGMNGLGRASVQLLEEMCSSDIHPNSLTLTSVLSACSHSGLVAEGLKVFHMMSVHFNFEPQMEHYICVLDLLARAGQLEEAVVLIRQMPYDPDKRIWGSILAASLEEQNVKIGVLASEHLVQLEPENTGQYVTLSNLYAKAGRPDDAVKVRKLMESRGLVKVLGYSSISSGI